MSNRVSEFCTGCVKITATGRCLAIKNPKYFWENYGKCFAFSDDPDWLKKYHRAVQDYADRKHSGIVEKAG